MESLKLAVDDFLDVCPSANTAEPLSELLEKEKQKVLDLEAEIEELKKQLEEKDQLLDWVYNGAFNE